MTRIEFEGLHIATPLMSTEFVALAELALVVEMAVLMVEGVDKSASLSPPTCPMAPIQ